MVAGRKPKPSALHDLEGTRNRRKNSEPRFGGIPSCPKHLDKAAKAEWKRVSPELADAGLLTSVDRAAFAAYCSTWARWIDAEMNVQKFGAVIQSPKSGYPVQNPYVGIANTSLDQMRKFASEFGMTPASRARIHVEKADSGADPFTEFMTSIGAADEMTTDETTKDRIQ